MKTWWMAGLGLLLLGGVATAQETAELRVISTQPGALVFVDRKMVGNAPVDVKVTPGRHLVRVSVNENFFPFEDSVDVKEKEVVSVNANLRRSAWSWYEEGIGDFTQGRLPDARVAFQSSLDSPGKQNPANYFYLGLIDERSGNLAGAEQELTQYVGYRDEAPAGHYQLGLVREKLGQTGPAATQYKLALFRENPQYEAWTKAAPKPTVKAQNTLAGQTDAQHRVQLAYVQEQKGNLEAARALYRVLAEQEAAKQGIDLSVPAAENKPVLLDPVPVPAPAP